MQFHRPERVFDGRQTALHLPCRQGDLLSLGGLWQRATRLLDRLPARVDGLRRPCTGIREARLIAACGRYYPVQADLRSPALGRVRITRLFAERLSQVDAEILATLGEGQTLTDYRHRILARFDAWRAEIIGWADCDNDLADPLLLRICFVVDKTERSI